MPKLKTHQGTAKRIKATKSGKLLRLHAGDKHFNQKKSARRMRATAVEAVVTGAIKKNLKQAMGA